MCGGNALDAELGRLEWVGDGYGTGRSAETAASKMRYQMNRLRLAANFELQREGPLRRHRIDRACAVSRGRLAERVHGAAFYFARYRVRTGETDHRAGGGCLSGTQSRLVVDREPGSEFKIEESRGVLPWKALRALFIERGRRGRSSESSL